MEALRTRFSHPGLEYAPVPFYFLNGNLTKVELRRQLRDFAQKGVGGVVLHPRMGLDARIGYLSAVFMELIAFAVKTAREEGLCIVLYDEGMYPSGSACGQVVRENPEYASRGLHLVQAENAPGEGRLVARVAVQKTGEEAYKGESARVLVSGEHARPDETVVCLMEDFSRGTIRGVHEGEDDGEENAPPSADLLNEEAVRCFIRLTHERYFAVLGDEFGKTIKAMFTDEPDPLGRNAPTGMRPFTSGLEEEWVRAGGQLKDLPALFWDAGARTQEIRAAFERLVTARMIRTYYRPLRAWCDAHGIALTGHPAHGDSIGIERVFTIPGQDLVWRYVAPGRSAIIGPESTQAKCAADSARHTGKRRNASECFGCCGPAESQWGMKVSDMKWMLDYLFVRGTNLVFPHAFFYAVDTPVRFGDRPPDVGPNNYWWAHQKRLSDYIARMCSINTDGVNQARVAILTGAEHLPYRLAAALFERQIAFNYLEVDDLLRAHVADGCVCIERQRYSVVAVEDSALITPKVHERLSELIQSGGTVTAVGEGGRQSITDVAMELVGMGLEAVVLSPSCTDVRAEHIVHGNAHVFLITNEGEGRYEGTLTLREAGACERWDALTGEMHSLGTRTQRLPLTLNARASVLYVVDEQSAPKPETPAPLPPSEGMLSLSGSFTLTGPDSMRHVLDALVDWQRIQGLERYSGTVVYEATFTLHSVPERAVLSLGDVRELAVVSLNGMQGEALLLPPFEMDVSEQLRVGENRLRVEVTSSRVTHFDGISWPCGLLGPVTLKGVDEGVKD